MYVQMLSWLINLIQASWADGTLFRVMVSVSYKPVYFNQLTSMSSKENFIKISIIQQ